MDQSREELENELLGIGLSTLVPKTQGLSWQKLCQMEEISKEKDL